MDPYVCEVMFSTLSASLRQSSTSHLSIQPLQQLQPVPGSGTRARGASVAEARLVAKTSSGPVTGASFQFDLEEPKRARGPIREEVR